MTGDADSGIKTTEKFFFDNGYIVWFVCNICVIIIRCQVFQLHLYPRRKQV